MSLLDKATISNWLPCIETSIDDGNGCSISCLVVSLAVSERINFLYGIGPALVLMTKRYVLLNSNCICIKCCLFGAAIVKRFPFKGTKF